MLTYLIQGKLTEEGHDTLKQGPETVRQFVNQINVMGDSSNELERCVLNDSRFGAGAAIDWATRDRRGLCG